MPPSPLLISKKCGLILEIFSDRAASREGVLQVELAALTYQRSRLVRAWTHLERQRGGLGFVGGPGETQIESDRRAIDDSIFRIKGHLKKVKKNTRAQKATDSIEIDTEVTSNFKILLWFLIGGISLWGGSELLVAGAVGIAQFFEVSNRVIAVSMIAVGTSIPELAASVVAALKHEKALLIGNIIGSNIFNIASVIGITALVRPIMILESSLPLLLKDVMWMLGFSLAIYLLARLPKKYLLTRYKGVLLCVAYAIFMISVFVNYN